jgi:sRNA-binding carbon storage regulator CsrA
MLSGGIEVLVVEIRGDSVRLGVTAPPAVKIARDELLQRAGDLEGFHKTVETETASRGDAETRRV